MLQRAALNHMLNKYLMILYHTANQTAKPGSAGPSTPLRTSSPQVVRLTVEASPHVPFDRLQREQLMVQFQWGLQVGPDGFGDSNNWRTCWNNSVAAGSLYIGAWNWANGGEVWLYLHRRVYLPLVMKSYQ